MSATKLEVLRQRMLMVARRYLGTAAEAEDVVQDSLLRLLDHGTEDEELTAHAITTVRSRAIDCLRTRRSTIQINERTDGGSDRSAEELMIEKERRKRVESLIDSLPPTQQMVMKMCHYDGLSNHEIALLTGMAEGTVRQNISRARLRMTEQYKRIQR